MVSFEPDAIETKEATITKQIAGTNFLQMQKILRQKGIEKIHPGELLFRRLKKITVRESLDLWSRNLEIDRRTLSIILSGTVDIPNDVIFYVDSRAKEQPSLKDYRVMFNATYIEAIKGLPVVSNKHINDDAPRKMLPMGIRDKEKAHELPSIKEEVTKVQPSINLESVNSSLHRFDPSTIRVIRTVEQYRACRAKLKELNAKYDSLPFSSANLVDEIELRQLIIDQWEKVNIRDIDEGEDLIDVLNEVVDKGYRPKADFTQAFGKAHITYAIFNRKKNIDEGMIERLHFAFGIDKTVSRKYMETFKPVV